MLLGYLFFYRLCVVPAFSFVIDTAVWQMETNCTVKASEWQGAGECQTWCWKTMKREPQVFVGDSDLTDPNIKYLLKRRRKGERDFRQAAVKLGELTMAALFLAGDMGWGEMGRLERFPRESLLRLSKVTTNWISDKFPRPDTTLCRAKKNKQQMARFEDTCGDTGCTVLENGFLSC